MLPFFIGTNMLQIDTKWQKQKRMSDERLKICNECDRYEPELTRCRECGCIMKVKSHIPNAHCPINKWGRYEEETTTE